MGLQRYYNRKAIFKFDHQKSGQNLKKYLIPSIHGSCQA